MSNQLQSRLNQIAAHAAAEIAAAVRHDISEEIRLESEGGGRPAGAPRQATAPAPKTATTGSPGGRRRSGWSEDDVSKALNFIRAQPGLRSEQIAKALQFDGKRMFKVLARLRETHQVTVTGYGRGGAYSST